MVTTAFLYDFRHLDPTQAQHIMVNALDATYRQQEEFLGTYHVYGPEGAHSMSITVERIPGSNNRYRLEGEESIIGA